VSPGYFDIKLCNAVAKRKEGEAVQFDNVKKFSPLAVTELDFAERAIIRSVQDVSFSEELLSLHEDVTETSQEIQQHSQARSCFCRGNYVR